MARLSDKELQDELLDALSGDEIDPHDFAYVYAKEWADENEIPFDPEEDDPHEFVEKHEKDFARWLDHENKLYDAFRNNEDLPARYHYDKARPVPADAWLLRHVDDHNTLAGGAAGTQRKLKKGAPRDNLSDELYSEDRIYARAYPVDDHPQVSSKGLFVQDYNKREFLLVRTPTAVITDSPGDRDREAQNQVFYPLDSESEEYPVWGDRYGVDWVFATNGGGLDYRVDTMEDVIALAPLKEGERVEAALIERAFAGSVRKYVPAGWGRLVYEAVLDHEDWDRDVTPQYVAEEPGPLVVEVIRRLNLYKRPTDDF